MGKFKRLRGAFDFRGEQQDGDPDSQSQFMQLYELLKGRFSGMLPTVDVASRTAFGPHEISEPRLFPVVLTFAERGGENEIGKLSTALHELLRRVIAAAKQLPGPLGAAAKILAAIDQILIDTPSAPEAIELKRIAQEEPSAATWPKVAKLLDRWPDLDFGDFRKELTRADWEAVLDKLRRHNPPAPPAVGLPVGAPAAAPPPGSPPPYELTQITGWMTLNGDTFNFEIEGRTRFPDDAVQYGAWGRLDVLGPDGGQLLTSFVGRDRLDDWLFGGGGDVGHVRVTVTSELRRALAEPAPHSKRTSSVHGRLWIDDGRVFGVRTVAVFVPPRFSQLMNACVTPFEEGSDSDELRDVLIAPQALAVTQTDENGYFEFSYPTDEEIRAGYALLHVTGLSAPIAVALVDGLPFGSGQSASKRFEQPILVQVDANLVVAKEKDVRWLDDDDEADGCGCRGAVFDEPNRAVDEFNFDVVVRTTDPTIVRGSVDDPDSGLRSGDDPAKPPLEGAINDYFRTSLSRTERLRWDDRSKIAQAVTISHGRVLTISQTWHADGYSLGDLRYSLPLAPLQKKNIAVVDWDRRDLLRLESDQEYRETMENFVGRERDISEIVNAALNETVNGSSESKSSSQSAGGGFGLGGLIFGGGSGGSSSAWSSASQNSNRTLASDFVNRLRDQTVQSANALRAQRVTTVQQVDQAERMQAVTETVANRNACHAITVQYFEVLRHFRVEHELVGVRECLFVPLPLSSFDGAKALRWRRPLLQYLPSNELRDALGAIDRQLTCTYPDTYAKERLLSIGADIRVRIDLPMPSAELKLETDWKTWLGVDLASPSPIPALVEKLKLLSSDKRSDYWETSVAPVLARKVISEWRFATTVGGLEVELPLSASLVSDYEAGGEHRVLLRAQADIANVDLTREEVTSIILKSSNISGAFGVEITGARFFVGTENLDTAISAGRDASGVANGTPLVLLLPLRPAELRSPKDEDARSVGRLVDHLNENLEFYHKAIWWTMDPDRRFILLDGYVAPNSGGRSVASVVENRLVAIIGNCLVLPVAPGIRLDYFVDGNPAEVGEEGLLAYYRPAMPPRPTRIAIPTKGVFAEAVMGSCNACERIDNGRNWQYWRHPLPDEPTAIDPVSLDSRARDTSVATPPEMPASPIVNQVVTSLPAAPDPSGLAAALAALTKSGVFPDHAGLAGTQQNAREGLSTTFATTQRFGELGAELSKEQLKLARDAMKMLFSAYTGIPVPLGDDGDGGSNSSSPASVRETITKDADAGRITKDQAQSALDRLNNVLVDGLGAKKSKELLDHPELSSAIGSASERGAPLSVSRGDTQVDIGKPIETPKRRNERGISWWGRLLGPDEAEAAEPSRPTSSRSVSFQSLADAYPDKERYPHDAFFDLLGGGWPALKADARFENTCALRLSHAFNVAGLSIPKPYRGRFMDGRRRPLIADVPTMEKALIAMFGRPSEDILRRPGTVQPPFANRGIVCLRGGFSDATGHVDLYDGANFYGGGKQAWIDHARTVKFWRLA